MDKFVEKKGILSYLVPAVIILGVGYWLIMQQFVNSGVLIKVACAAICVLLFYLYLKINSTGYPYVITDKKISAMSQTGEFCYGIDWDDVKYKHTDIKGNNIRRITLFAKDRLELGSHPLYRLKKAKDMNFMQLSMNVDKPEEYLKLIQKYSKDIPNKSKEELLADGVNPIAFKATPKEHLGTIAYLAFFVALVWLVFFFKPAHEGDSENKSLTVEERKILYSGGKLETK